MIPGGQSSAATMERMDMSADVNAKYFILNRFAVRQIEIKIPRPLVRTKMQLYALKVDNSMKTAEPFS